MQYRLTDTVASGEPAFGAWISLREPLIAEAASRSGYDYVCIDLQHGLSSWGELAGMLQAVASGSAMPVCRVPWNEPWMIGRALDSGALGVVVPMVNTAEEAERAAAAVGYPPAGERSFGPVAAMTRYSPGYLRQASDVLCIVQIETAQAVENIDEIVSVNGIDAVYVGPVDLSLSMGLPAAIDHREPRFHEALARIVEACEERGVIAGIHASADLAQARRDAGFQMITVGFDHAPIVSALARDLEHVRMQDRS